MFDPNIYTPDKLNIIFQTIIFNVVVSFGLLAWAFWLWRQKNRYLGVWITVFILAELFLFARGDLLTAPRSQINLQTSIASFGLDRYVSSSDVIAYTGPQVYWNHIRVRQPFAPDLSNQELSTFDRLQFEIDMLPGNLNMLSHRYSITGYSAVVLDNYARYWLSKNINSVSIPDLDDTRLNTLGVRYLVSGYPQDFVEPSRSTHLLTSQPVNVYWRDNAKDRVFLTNAGEIHLTSYQPEKVTISTESLISNRLVFTDSYYPGWKAFIDGKESQIDIFDQAFRQLEVPSGKHEIIFRYEPDSVRIGLWLSISSVTLVIILYGLSYWPVFYTIIDKSIKSS